MAKKLSREEVFARAADALSARLSIYITEDQDLSPFVNDFGEAMDLAEELYKWGEPEAVTKVMEYAAELDPDAFAEWQLGVFGGFGDKEFRALGADIEVDLDEEGW